jgi:hypothetical protein
MITRVQHLRAKRDIGTCLVGQVLKRNFIGGHRNTNRWWQHHSGRPCDMVGKAKWAKGPALVALDRGRDGRIGCVGLGRGKRLSMLAISWMISVKWLALTGSLGATMVGTPHCAQRKSIGNGGASKEQSSATWSAALIIILVC